MSANVVALRGNLRDGARVRERAETAKAIAALLRRGIAQRAANSPCVILTFDHDVEADELVRLVRRNRHR